MKFFILSIIGLFATMAVEAQIPRIEIRDRGNESKVNVFLESMSADVEIFGNLAVTKLKLSFHNPSDRLLEGTLIFPLPERSTVTAFSLDINDVMRPAVAVEKERASAIFESVERRRIDPGLLEKTVGNNFRLRIYPIPARGNRTVEIIFRQDLQSLNSQLIYQMPMPELRLKEFRLTTTIYSSTDKPRLEESPDDSFDFLRTGNAWHASVAKQNYLPRAALRVALPPMSSCAMTLMQRASDGTYFFAAMIPTGIVAPDRVRTDPKTIGIVWDNSLSRLKADKDKEKAFLKSYLQGRDVTVKFSTVNILESSPQILTIKNGNVDKLIRLLDAITYDGGTDLGCLSLSDADEYLFFSDGISSFGKMGKLSGKYIHTIASSAIADDAKLKAVSRATQGLFVNLAEMPPEHAAMMLRNNPIRFLGVEPDEAISEIYPLSNTPLTNEMQLITGISRTPSARINLLVGYDRHTAQRIPISLAEATHTDGWRIDQIWAGQKVEALESDPTEHRAALIDLGKRYGVVSSVSSLLVLETVEDYVKYGITPPSDLHSEYNMRIQNKNKESERSKKEMMVYAEETIKTLKEWWHTDWRKQRKAKKKPELPLAESPILESTEIVAVLSNRTPGVELMGMAEAQEDEKSTIDLRANYLRKADAKGSGLQGSFREIELNSDANYMQPMQRFTSMDQAYTKYLTFRELFLSTPSYYIDMARWFFAQGDKARGLLILSNLSELNFEDARLYRTLAFELKKQGFYDKALFVLSEVLRLRPFELQSYRDYALALADNGKMQEALDTLYAALTQEYTEEALAWSKGMEETVLMELNRIIHLGGKRLNTAHINPKLIADLPVDIRVVLNWNMDHTDIDLHVTDPEGEVCSYSMPSTSSGGRLSRDITDGLGPEQFLLRKAKFGKYRIETNFFGERQLSFSGPTTIMAEVYLYYSSGKEERKVIVFESPQDKGSGNKILIGTFEFR